MKTGEKQNSIMNWNTIYIKGKCGFEKEVLDNIEHSKLSFMPGSMAELKNVALYWVDEKASLRDFKKAIGSKTVLKYRLQFFTSLEEVEQVNENTESFTPQEEAMIRKMADWEEDHVQYKHSA